MAPSAGLVSLLADHATPSFLLEVAVENLESLDEKISECELGMKECANDDERKKNDEEEGRRKVCSNGNDDNDQTNKEELEWGAEQRTRGKGSEGSHFKKENEAELVRLRKGRDVMVQDVYHPPHDNLRPSPPPNPTSINAKTSQNIQIRWLQALHARTPSPSFPSSTQTPHSNSSSTSTPTHNPPSFSPNSPPNPLSSPSVHSRPVVQHRSGGSIGSGTTATATSTVTAHHQSARRTRAEGPWGRRSKVRGRERVRRPRSGGDGAVTTAAMVGSRDAGSDTAVCAEEKEEIGTVGVAL